MELTALLNLVKWIGSTLYLIGMVLTALNIYPINLVFGAAGGTIWMLVGLKQKDNPLFIVEAASAFVYLTGFVLWLGKPLI